VLATFAVVGQLILSAVCCGQAGAITQTVSAGGLPYVIICSTAGTQRIPLAEYLAGQRPGEPTGESGGIFGCAHCSTCSLTALAVAAFLIMFLTWAAAQQTRALTINAVPVLRPYSARGPPLTSPSSY
jgi:hypothetical protein